MRATVLLFFAAGLFFLVGPQGHTQDSQRLTPVPEAPERAPTPPPSISTTGWDRPAVAVSAKPDPVNDLVQVLHNTQSLDTLFVTLELLEEMGQTAQPAIPGILRNAERLGVFKSHLMSRDRDSEYVEKVVGALRKIRSADSQQASPVPCVPCR